MPYYINYDTNNEKADLFLYQHTLKCLIPLTPQQFANYYIVYQLKIGLLYLFVCSFKKYKHLSIYSHN